MISSLYDDLPSTIEDLLQHAITKGLANGTGKARLFFRADDIAVPGKQFTQLIESFRDINLPLCLAVVPTWLTPSRFNALQDITGKKSSQWCWHQHGWLHKNHETTGKKQEFGTARSAHKQLQDLQNGKNRLQHIMDESFSLFFTPPWNRCSMDTLNGLHALGFKAISRSRNARPDAPSNLPDLQINIDIHTRKEPDPKQSLNALLSELEQGISSGTGGIMIHHQRMNQTAFYFLKLLLTTIRATPQIEAVSFSELLE